jgi:hypothetical protein
VRRCVVHSVRGCVVHSVRGCVVHSVRGCVVHSVRGYVVHFIIYLKKKIYAEQYHLLIDLTFGKFEGHLLLLFG